MMAGLGVTSANRAASSAARVATKLVPGDADIASVAAQTESLSVHLETGAAQMRDGDFLGALETYLAANAATPCAAATIGAARAETFLGRCDRATRATLSVIREDAGNVSAYAARGHALCLSDDFDQGVKHLKEALRLDPDCAEAQRAFRAMKKAGAALTRARDAVARRAFEEARVSFTETLALADVPNKSPLFAAVVSERAQASLRLRLYEEALAEAAEALTLAEAVTVLAMAAVAAAALGAVMMAATPGRRRTGAGHPRLAAKKTPKVAGTATVPCSKSLSRCSTPARR